MDAIYLTKSQIEKYNKSGELNLTKNVLKTPNTKFKLTKNQVTKLQNGEKITIKNKQGGFIPLVPLIAGIGTAVSAATSIYNSIQNKKTNDKLVEQRKKQNELLEKQYKEGKPIVVNTLKAEANKMGGSLTLKKDINGGALKLKKDVYREGGKLTSGQKMDMLIKSSRFK